MISKKKQTFEERFNETKFENEEDREIALKYQIYDQWQHVLLKPNMYIGDMNLSKLNLYLIEKTCDKIEQSEKELNYANAKLKLEEISYIPGLYKLVDELIVNAYDQFVRCNTNLEHSDTKYRKMTTIQINIDETSFSIINDGSGISIAKNKLHNDIYTVELIFGNLNSGENFNAKQTAFVGGTHGNTIE